MPNVNFFPLPSGKYHCPVLFTVFTNNSHIVAIKTTGNVFAYEVGSLLHFMSSILYLMHFI